MRAQEEKQLNIIKYSDLTNTFNVLDVLAQTKWKINSKVLSIMETLWEEGGNRANIPQRYIPSNQKVYLYHLKETKDYKSKS
jgi:DNA-directed RNA polymerase